MIIGVSIVSGPVVATAFAWMISILWQSDYVCQKCYYRQRSGYIVAWAQNVGSFREFIVSVNAGHVQKYAFKEAHELSRLWKCIEWSDIRNGHQVMRPGSVEIGYGWPLICWISRSVDQNATVPISDMGQYTIDFESSDPFREPSPDEPLIIWGRTSITTSSGLKKLSLPTTVHYSGLVIDGMCWATVLGGLITAFGLFRRALDRIQGRLRRWRGRCSKCSYDVSTIVSPHCPECGADLPERS